MSAPKHFLRLAVWCPCCGAPPRLRLPLAAYGKVNGGPDEVVLTYQCHVRCCRTIYEIRVIHFTEAA